MGNDINFQDKNHLSDVKRKNWDDLEWINELYEFLQGGEVPGISIGRGYKPKMSDKKANTIIWYLQEHLRILPDNIERCDNCGELYDSNCSGIYWESKGKNYCDGCEFLVPYNYDRGVGIKKKGR